MSIVYENLRNWKIPEVRLELTRKDTILYGLGLGLGTDPTDQCQLQFLYENRLRALPTMVVALCQPMGWMADPQTGIDCNKVVLGGLKFDLDRQPPVEGSLVGRTRVVEVVDKGEGKGALIFTETRLCDVDGNDRIGTVHTATIARADGGFGGQAKAPPPARQLPDRAPDLIDEFPVIPQLALIYRLSGDYNPLHADPAYAARAGFHMPILHGRATFGIAGIALLRTICDWDPAKLRGMDARFSSPVFPGDTIRTEVWRDGDVVSFRCVVPERREVVINNGRAEVSV